ncbi:MAG: alpha/beta hydrolase [Nitrospiraceae bacterium]|nr:alpha/beta hydrolase [Nitrospiraceae bacterium]
MSTELQPLDITVSGKRVHVRTGGAGPALLLLHAAWGDAEMSWQRVWSDLSRSFTVIAPDMPGFGLSEALKQPTLHDSVVLLRDLLVERNAGPAIVVGNSFGAAVAIEFTATFPEQTRSLVLVNGSSLPAIPGFLRKLVLLPALARRFRALMRNMTYSDKAFARAFPDPALLPPGFIDRIRRNEEQQARVVFETFINQRRQQKRPQVRASIIWGTGDRLVPAKQAERLRHWLGAEAIIPIHGAGHMPQVERPEAFAEALRQAAK